MKGISLELPQEKFNQIILELLIEIKADLDATKNLLISPQIETMKDYHQLNASYVEMRAAALSETLAHLKAKFGLDSVDDLLGGIS